MFLWSDLEKIICWFKRYSENYNINENVGWKLV